MGILIRTNQVQEHDGNAHQNLAMKKIRFEVEFFKWRNGKIGVGTQVGSHNFSMS